uniref:G_PROTEIN_RECEP_F1_2 domain-containing protein n=1 Tax=Toxocara canis TaxID=6265 RepID=A0A183TWY1_TOXCA
LESAIDQASRQKMTITSQGANPKEDLYAAIMICVIAITGLLTNGLAILTVFRKKHLHNSFGYTCISHAAGGFGVLCIFAFWVTPILFMKPSVVPRIMEHSRLSYTVGQVTIFFYYGAIYTHVLLASNRFIVICKPLSYSSYFSIRMTIYWIILVWVIAFIQSAIYQIDGCHYFFEKTFLNFVYSQTQCGLFMSSKFEFCINIMFVIFIMLVDTLTSIKLKISAKVNQARAIVSEAALNRRRSQEIRFFLQSVCSEVTIVVCFSSFWGFSRLAESKWATFLLTTIAWELLHAFDGVILIAFNRNVHFLWCLRRRKQPPQSRESVDLKITRKGRIKWPHLNTGDRAIKHFVQPT